MKLFKNKKKSLRPLVEINVGSFVDPIAQIGDYTYIGRHCKISRCSIGRYCSIGDDVSIGPGEHDINTISTSAFLYSGSDWGAELLKKTCVIDNDVWIGANVVIRRGVHIGTGAVIGAHSFVNKDVPPFAVVGGSPARIIKYRFDENMQQKILKSKYWEFSPEQAKTIIEAINDK